MTYKEPTTIFRRIVEDFEDDKKPMGILPKSNLECLFRSVKQKCHNIVNALGKQMGIFKVKREIEEIFWFPQFQK